MRAMCLRWLLPVLLLSFNTVHAQRPAPGKAATRRAAARAKPAKPKATVPAISQATILNVGDTLDGRFVVPQVQLPDAAAAARINAELVDAALGEDLQVVPLPLTALTGLRQAVSEYTERDQKGFVGARYEVLYNDHGLLSVALTSDLLGAYASSVTRHATFELRTGRLLEVRDLLADTLALRQRWQESINRRVADHISKLPTEYAQLDAPLLAEVKRRLHWNDSTLTSQLEGDDPRFYDFALTPFGLTLYYDFGFPHVLEALQPETDYLFSYATLTPWLKPRGLLDFKR
ncbi:hypothetical protein KBK19_18335 [Microvirga sp. STR05]|uniref:DUF3298 domain-containing protein n=1 Tax=Hymenobacter duratus TaxID=2771356 RepID=A0ABR8JNL2_9BACT|nr:hypothetical protein [Hymenobacter duratus]MBD2717010.1 hypothetical protein [Hymenobacter duratus]MBR7951926.1 hypothetical protein [Microvirga sp. STR05]